MVIKIFTDSDCKNEVTDRILYEGKKYTLDWSNCTTDERKAWIKQTRIEEHISYHLTNDLASIKLVNVVGFVDFFGVNFDVRSAKFYQGLDGNEQFKSMLKDLVKISSRMTFLYSGIASAKRVVELGSYNLNDVERFDYFYQFTFDFPIGSNLSSLLTQILKQPNNITTSFIEKTPISKSKNISKNFSRQISNSKSFGIVSEGHPLENTSLVKKINNISGQNYIPLFIDNIKKRESFDTNENRFVKFLLQEIKSICLRLLQNVKDTHFIEKINNLSRRIDYHLRHPFFKEIGRLHYLPESSSVLLNKAGYRELYYHYIQSKFGFNSIIEELTKTSMKAGLKNIAKLYEIWVFFKIGSILFNDETIIQSFRYKNIKEGAFIKRIIWNNHKVELRYNVLYGRRNNKSYSLSMKPDITIKINGKLYLFDAKYKFKTKPLKEDEELIQKWIKAEDIHKMHAYLDSIKEAKFSIAVYPGTDFVFYNKHTHIMTRDIKDISFEGVGAIPLVPSVENKYFESFFKDLIDFCK